MTLSSSGRAGGRSVNSGEYPESVSFQPHEKGTTALTDRPTDRPTKRDVESRSTRLKTIFAKKIGERETDERMTDHQGCPNFSPSI